VVIKNIQANELNNISGSGNNVWKGSTEWDVPGTSHRISVVEYFIEK
jgi:hypothetical protein